MRTTSSPVVDNGQALGADLHRGAPARHARIAGLGMAALVTLLMVQTPDQAYAQDLSETVLDGAVGADAAQDVVPACDTVDTSPTESSDEAVSPDGAPSDETVAAEDSDAVPNAGAIDTPAATTEVSTSATPICGDEVSGHTAEDDSTGEAQPLDDPAQTQESSSVETPDVVSVTQESTSASTGQGDGNEADAQETAVSENGEDTRGEASCAACPDGGTVSTETEAAKADTPVVATRVSSPSAATARAVSSPKQATGKALKSASSDATTASTKADPLENWKLGHWATRKVNGLKRRYWVGDDGSIYKGGLIDPTWGKKGKKAGFWAFASPKTGNAIITTYTTKYKGKRIVFLADMNGKLAKQKGGWLVTSAYDKGKLHRYYVDPQLHGCVVGYHAAKGGVYAHYTLSKKGYVIRTPHKIGDKIYVADNDGKLLGSSKSNTGQWIVTAKITGKERQRYYIKNNAAPAGLFKVKDAKGTVHRYYGTNKGYVLRGKMAMGSGMLLADNDGKLAWTKGWVTTKAYDGTSQKYYVGNLGNGYRGAKVGLLKVDGKRYYGREDTGYIVRNGAYAVSQARVRTGAVVDTKVAVADKNGVLLTRAQVGAKVVAAARSQLGCSYSYVDNGYFPGNSFNCSGLSWWTWYTVGVKLPHNQGYYSYYANQTNTTNSQMWSVQSLGNWRTSIADLKPGDLVFFSPVNDKWHTGHVGVYIGGGKMIDSNTTGVLVRDVARSTYVGGGLPVTIV